MLREGYYGGDEMCCFCREGAIKSAENGEKDWCR